MLAHKLRRGLFNVVIVYVSFLLLFVVLDIVDIYKDSDSDCFYVDDVKKFLNLTKYSRDYMQDVARRSIHIDKNWTNLGSVTYPLKLVVFTTFINTTTKFPIQANVVRNWALFLPEVQPVLFADYSPGLAELINMAVNHGWHVYPIQSTNSYGTPRIKDMYFFTQKKYKSHFYGLSNGDILFDSYLAETLAIAISGQVYLKTTMITGKRRQVKLHLADIQNNSYYTWDDVVELRKRGRGSRTDTEDYFFISQPETFPWKAIPNLVIGRPGYDNFLVGIAVLYNVSVIDASRTLSPVHITSYGKGYRGSGNEDAGFNKHIIREMYGRFNFLMGSTNAAPWVSRRDRKGEVELVCRFRDCAQRPNNRPLFYRPRPKNEPVVVDVGGKHIVLKPGKKLKHKKTKRPQKIN